MAVKNTLISVASTALEMGGEAEARILCVRGSWRFRCVKVGFAVAQDVLGVLVMLGVLLQTPKATGLGGTIGGGGDSGGGYRRRRGLEASLLRVTIIFIVLFVGVSIVQTYVGAH
jgi:protein translocase SecG subunit